MTASPSLRWATILIMVVVSCSCSRPEIVPNLSAANIRQRQSGYAMPILFALVALSYAVNIPSLVVGVVRPSGWTLLDV